MTPLFGRAGRARGRKDSESPGGPESPDADVERGITETAANSRVVTVTEELIGRVLRLRQAEAMIGELDDAIARLRGAAAEAGDGPAEPLAAGESGRDIRSARDHVNEGLRLIVLKLAATGESRDEIAATLEDDFSVADGDAVVGSVLDVEASPWR